MSEQNSISVKIMGKDYKIKCPPEKIARAWSSAQIALLQEIRDAGHVLGIVRIAVIAALNIAHDMLILKKQKNAYIELLNKRIMELQQKIERALASET